MGWIERSESAVSDVRITDAVAAAEALAFEQARVDREQRDAITAFRLELAIGKFPAEALLL